MPFLPLVYADLATAAADQAGGPPQPTPLILDQGRADRAGPPATAPAPLSSEEGLTSVTTAVEPAVIRGVDFGGTAVPADVAEAARPFLGKAADRATLQALAKALSDAYAKSDVALYTVAIPAQNMVDGKLVVQVAEGFIESVDFPDGSDSLLLAYAARLQAEKPLTRRLLQRYLAMMRDIPGTTVDAQLRGGTSPGGVVLVIKAKRERTDFALGFDNRGTRLLGDGQLRGEAHGYSLLRRGDRTDLTLLSGANPKRLRYASAAHSTPLGSDGATLSLSAGHLDTQQRGSPIEGDATTGGITLAWPLIRGNARNLSLSLGLDLLNSDAAAFGTLLSSDRTRALRAAAGFSDVAGRRVITASLSLSRGLDILGGRGTPGFTDITATKLNGRVTLDRQFANRIALRLRAAGQYSSDRLAPAERFAIGGGDFGRAFDQATLTGDRGYALLGELGWRPLAAGLLAGTELYAFADTAEVWIEARGPYRAANYDLASAGLGARLAVGRAAWLELEGARSVDDPYPGYRGNWRFNVAWRLALNKM